MDTIRGSLPSPSGIIAKNGPALALALLCGCGGSPPAPRSSTGVAPAAPPSPGAAATPRAAVPGPQDDGRSRPDVLFLGTSLTAGYGLDPAEAYPALIQAKMDAAGLAYRVVNAGVSGETSAGARRRLDWLLQRPVAVLVLETGANDGLRGQDPEATRANIQAIFDRARRQSPPPRLVLAGMEALPNYGAGFGRRFRAIFPELARKNGAALVPFLLEGVAGVAALNQADGIHPNAKGHERVAETVWRTLRPLL